MAPVMDHTLTLKAVKAETSDIKLHAYLYNLPTCSDTTFAVHRLSQIYKILVTLCKPSITIIAKRFLGKQAIPGV